LTRGENSSPAALSNLQFNQSGISCVQNEGSFMDWEEALLCKQDNPALEGFLVKRGDRWLRRWEKRRFVLAFGVLRCLPRIKESA